MRFHATKGNRIAPLLGQPVAAPLILQKGRWMTQTLCQGCEQFFLIARPTLRSLMHFNAASVAGHTRFDGQSLSPSVTQKLSRLAMNLITTNVRIASTEK
jgi:hypothetical protein